MLQGKEVLLLPCRDRFRVGEGGSRAGTRDRSLMLVEEGLQHWRRSKTLVRLLDYF